jgi:transposase-like protein
MVAVTPAAVLAAVPKLDLADLERLAEAVGQAIKAKRAPAPAPAGPGPACPHCGVADPWRWGATGATRRWRCRGCRRTFTEFTKTPLAFAKRRPQLLAAAADMLADKPRSCRKLARALGVHRMTVWRWRVRMLRAVEEIGERTTGLAEADETFFRESRKGSREWALFAKGEGPEPPRPRWREFDRRKKKLPRGLSRWQIPVLTLRDRHGATYARRLANLRLPAFEPVLDAGLAPDAVLCTDGGAVYRRWAQRRKRVVEQVDTRRGIRVRNGVYHIQNANAFHSRFKAFMAPFCGPATRHLPLYVGWMVLRDQLRGAEAGGQPLLERFLRHGRQVDLTRKKLPDLASPIPVQLSLPLPIP